MSSKRSGKKSIRSMKRSMKRSKGSLHGGLNGFKLKITGGKKMAGRQPRGGYIFTASDDEKREAIVMASEDLNDLDANTPYNELDGRTKQYVDLILKSEFGPDFGRAAAQQALDNAQQSLQKGYNYVTKGAQNLASNVAKSYSDANTKNGINLYCSISDKVRQQFSPYNGKLTAVQQKIYNSILFNENNKCPLYLQGIDEIDKYRQQELDAKALDKKNK
jgi:hypothetical protein